MLILTRRISEKIIVDNGKFITEVKVVSIRGRSARVRVKKKLKNGDEGLEWYMQAVSSDFNILPNVNVTVVFIKGNQVKLGFDAPKEVEIHRLEIWQKIHLESKIDETYIAKSTQHIPLPDGEYLGSACGFKVVLQLPKLGNIDFNSDVAIKGVSDVNVIIYNGVANVKYLGKTTA